MPPLPTELIEQILQSFDPAGSEDAMSLMKIGRVNRAWHAVARERLYKTVYVQSPKDEAVMGMWGLLEKFGRVEGMKPALTTDDWDDSDYEGKFDGKPSEEPARLSMDAPTQRLWHTFNEDATLASIVEELVFQGPFETEHGASAVRRFLTVCPNLRSVRLAQRRQQLFAGRTRFTIPETESSDAVFMHLWKRRANLKSLDANVISEQGTLAIGALHEFKDLEHVRLVFEEEGGVAVEMDDEFFDCEPEYKLKSLTMGLVLEPELFDRLTRSSFESLESLSVYIRRRALDLSRFKHLKQVTLHGAVDVWKSIGDTLATLPPSVTSVEIVHNLLITGLDHQRSRGGFFLDKPEHAETRASRRRERTHPDEFTLAAAIKRLPARVTHLEFGDYVHHPEIATLVNVLEDRSWLPHLASLAIPCEIYEHYGEEGYNADEDEEEGGSTSEMVRNIQEGQNSLEAACRARGIRFYLRRKNWQARMETLDFVPRVFMEMPEDREEAGEDAEWEDYDGSDDGDESEEVDDEEEEGSEVDEDEEEGSEVL
ncbi:hypothetical protein JCM10908_007337 [Rhodotorula pacifica]|uniref:F-box protein n=1 Tax=Rhodotorula pacifica TaxID=1495444 RepID=UPI00317E1627